MKLSTPFPKSSRICFPQISLSPYVLAYVVMAVFFTASFQASKTFAANNGLPIDKGSPWNPAQSDQWMATDNLLRTLPTYDEVGATRPDKYVACFYFLWNGRHGDTGPYNISQILKEHPEAKDDPNSPHWGALGIPHHWGESIFGYYVGEDEAVLRKHAQMLGDAGVDVICFDVTNQLTYPESYRPLFKVFSEMQKEGNKVPKVAFLCPFWSPNKVVRELWREVYSQNYYPDVWFNWKGKPLILADPKLLAHSSQLTSENCVPSTLDEGTSLTQKFFVDAEFEKIIINSPTWEDVNSAVDFTLRAESGEVLDSRRAIKVDDNVPFTVNFKKAFPAGIYSVELRKAPGGRVGWWSRPVEGDNYEEAALKAFNVKGIRWLEATRNGKKENLVRMISVSQHDDETEQILEFFTFRPPQPDYFIGQTKPNQWSWLEAYPQHEFYNDKGELEQMSVGVAQNAVEGKLGVLSNPRSYGRSFHNGAEPAPEDCDYTGRNFQEQWEHALEADPQIIFVTSWNEWIAGRFAIDAPFHGATPVTFVDQYNQEFSRDCEPMKGGHEDAYYYQLISNIRRFKGVSKPSLGKPQPIKIDGSFEDWASVSPKFYDTIGDPTHRDCRGYGKGVRYVNETGRNDFIEALVSYDQENLYFYIKTKSEIQGNLSSDNWLSLLLDVDENAQTGNKGNDFIISSNGQDFILSKTSKDEAVATSAKIEFKITGNELELSVPRKALEMEDQKVVFHFKWTDGINVFDDWSSFTTDGDAAPNDRYYYRYESH